MTAFPEDQCPSCKHVKAVRFSDMAFRLLDKETTLTEQTEWYECDHCGELFDFKETFYQDTWRDPAWDEQGITI